MGDRGRGSLKQSEVLTLIYLLWVGVGGLVAHYMVGINKIALHRGHSPNAPPTMGNPELGSLSICPRYVFRLAAEKQILFSIFHHDYKQEQSIKRTKTEHQCNFKTTGEYNLSFLSLKKLQVHRKLEKSLSNF